MRVGYVGVVIGAVLVAALASPARADDRGSVGVVVQGAGELRAKLEGHLAARLKREGYAADVAPLSRDALNTLSNCFILEDLACARGVVEARAKTPSLVFAQVDATGETPVLSVTWFSAGHAPVAAKEACRDCRAAWESHADGLVTQVLAEAQAPIVTEAPPASRRQKRSKLWPSLLVSVGAAAVVGGGVALYYGLRDGESHKYIYPGLTPVGITLIAVGGGAVIGGIITW